MNIRINTVTRNKLELYVLHMRVRKRKMCFIKVY